MTGLPLPDAGTDPAKARPGDQVQVTYHVVLVPEPSRHDPMHFRLATGPVTVKAVDRLGCGCTRLRTDRPGSAYLPVMELLTGCAVHESSWDDGGDR